MLSDKLLRILRSKAPFSEAELAAMTEAEGWRWVYGQKERGEAPAHQVCFTGFSLDEKAELAALASRAGLEVVRSITKRLSFLCTGPTPGPAKLEKAEAQGVLILTRSQFEHLVATGEVPRAGEAA